MISRRRFLATAAGAAGMIGLSACTPPSADGGAGSDEAIVIYSNSVSDGRSEWLVDKAKKAGFEVRVVEMGGADVKNRLLAEKAAPIADVTFGMNNVYFEALKAEGVLAEYKPSWAVDVDEALCDGKTFWPIVREPIMIIYKDSAYPDGKGAPTSWTDLWTKPEYEKKYEVPSTLGGGTAQMVISGILSRYKDDSGELGVSKEGWDNIKSYFAKGVPSVKGKDLFARMKAGEVDMGSMWLAGKVAREKEYGVKTTPIYPADGVPIVVQQVALVKGSKKEEQSKKFIDWFGGAEVQSEWSKKFFTAPANEKAAKDGNTEAIEATDKFKRQDIDWSFVSKNLTAWIEKIELDVIK
ncbi:substrate-binding domain-containing protein [Dermabacteraceae bacterium TAE3-ERU27]|nr:substrate-binding domain-containing protein [Dermabacteraceae bacterium TAE3-ERU27]